MKNQPNYLGATITAITFLAVADVAFRREKSLLALFFKQLGS